ncbi:hypothetical protein AA0242T_0419 [Acetobacter aceti NRIC 0242]|nr:hypothetical protein Abac_006_041 [Acetobacter aceti NBRC 14818]GBO79717.1 hypothetical protein AA0242T_0419 [Acetobacter aceti NRIC 0242]
MSHSSRGLGHRPLTAATGVRIPYGTPDLPTPYMLRRHHTWYLRIHVLADLRHIVGQYVVRFLKMEDRSLAQARTVGLAFYAQDSFFKIKMKLAALWIADMNV